MPVYPSRRLGGEPDCSILDQELCCENGEFTNERGIVQHIFDHRAVIAAILSFFVGAFWGFVLAIIAIVAAIIGIVVAVSPQRGEL